MTLIQLKYILAVDAHRHFGKAAEACHVAQPSLSTQVQKLEEELTIRLFERGRNSCLPTEAGREVLKQARRVLEEAQRIEDIVQTFQQEVKGTLRLGVIPTLAPFLLPYLLKQVRKKYPHLQFELFEEKTSQLMKWIESGDIDAAILSTPRTAPETVMEKVLFYEPFIVFLSPGHPLGNKKQVDIKELNKFRPFLLDDTHCLRDQVEKLCQHKTNTPQSLELKTGSLQTLVEIVNEASGYTLLPLLSKDFFTKKYPKRYREFKEPAPSRKVSLIFHRSFLKRPLIEALFTTVRENLPHGAIPVDRRSHTKVVDPQRSRFNQ